MNTVLILIAIGLALWLSGLSWGVVIDKSLAWLGRAMLAGRFLAVGIGLSTSKMKVEFDGCAVLAVPNLVALPATGWLISARKLRLPSINTSVIWLILRHADGCRYARIRKLRRHGRADASGVVVISTITFMSRLWPCSPRMRQRRIWHRHRSLNCKIGPLFDQKPLSNARISSCRH